MHLRTCALMQILAHLHTCVFNRLRMYLRTCALAYLRTLLAYQRTLFVQAPPQVLAHWIMVQKKIFETRGMISL